MMDKLGIIAGFAALMGPLYMLAMQSTPRRGWLRMMERLCVGIILCFLCQLALKPMGAEIAQSPLAALSAGYWGLPGVALATFLSLWP